jgi:crotonobetainyl-CoA:carnitine CoA-transferase CaiB-like acyl-CoA transferase
VEPLEGIRVVEVAVAVQGPGAGGFLADLGAEVIKVEPPWGDANRFFRGVNNTTPNESLGTQFLGVSSGKRSVSLDIHSTLGLDAVQRLVERSDVFLTNYREVALQRIGLGYEQLRTRNERLIYGIASGFGPLGPDASKRMSDQYAQARSGIASVTGTPASTTLIPGAIIGDTGGAMQLAMGIITALAVRERHGFGQKVETSAYGALIWMQSWEINHSSVTGHVLKRDGPFHPNTPGVVGIYETADGGAFCVGVGTERGWREFCRFAGMPELIEDPRWDTPEKRTGLGRPEHAANAGALRPYFASALKGQTTAEWAAFFEQNSEDILAQRVFDYAEVLEDPQAIENGYIVEKDIPHVGRRKVAGNPLRFSETPVSAKNSFPELGEHTVEVLETLGFSGAEIADLQGETEAALIRRYQRT